jgi:hypothetical protein
LTYGDIPILNDAVNITVLGDRIEFVSLTCHEIVATSTDSVTVMNCDAAVGMGLPDVKRVFPLGDSYAILEARLVYAGPIDRFSREATQQYLEFHPVWKVVFQRSPDAVDCGNICTVFLDAATGNYVGHRVK